MFHGTVEAVPAASRFGAFDSRAKILGILGFVACVSLLRDSSYLYLSLAFILSMLALSGAPLSLMGKRYLLALPFIAFASLSLYFTAGTAQSMAMFLRISTGVLAVIFLTLTTPFFDMLHGFQRLRVPGLIITMLLFTYRYIFVFQDELERMKQARKAKAYYGGGHLFSRGIMRTLANTAGMTLVRAYERGIRVQDSLRTRGFNGRINILAERKFSLLDLGLAGSFMFMAVVLVLSEYGVLLQ